MSQLGQTAKYSARADISGLPRVTDIVRSVRFVPILLKKSKVASVPIFDEILKRQAIDDSDISSRAAEVAHEFLRPAMRSLRSLHERRACGFLEFLGPSANDFFNTICQHATSRIRAAQRKSRPRAALQFKMDADQAAIKAGLLFRR